MLTRTWVAVGVLTLTSLLPAWSAAEKPAGWFLAGKDPDSYTMDVDDTVAHGGKSSARLASTRAPNGFGTMMQSCDPSEYRGKRVRLSAFVKTQDLKEWAGVWMRVDGAEQGRSLAFDNMSNRPIQGTMDWTRQEVVLDVPDEATNISFGILVNGEGKLWIDDIQFQVVDKSVPVTGLTGHGKPQNLSFEH